LAFNETHQLVIDADDDNLLGENTNMILKKATVIGSKEVVLEVNMEKVKYMLMSRHQTTRQNR
jgi:hypothetical protein